MLPPPGFHGSFEHAKAGAPTIEPHVENVRFLNELRLPGFGMGESWRDKGRGVSLKPNVRPLGFDRPSDVLDDIGVRNRLLRLCAVEDRNAHSPGPLPGDAPVGAVFNHRANPRATRLGKPIDPVHLFHHAPPKVLHVDSDEPLFGRTEDHRLAVPFGMRVAMVVRLGLEQPSQFSKAIDDDGVAILVGHARELPGLFGQDSPLIDRAKDGKPVLDPRVEVVSTMAGRSVNDTCALLDRHVVSQYADRSAIEDRMPELGSLEARPRDDASHFGLFPAQPFRHASHKVLRENVMAALDLHDGVFERGIEGDGQVRGDRPRSGGPNDAAYVVEPLRPSNLVFLQRKGNEDRLAGVIGIDDLRVGEGGSRGRAP
ncbi:MAG: hypothetical protein CNCCGFBP_01918 [Fimbriimonadaceae bacterium]|nr:hypothetical protein [Fimbriimonadaceae bacterium]